MLQCACGRIGFGVFDDSQHQGDGGNGLGDGGHGDGGAMCGPEVCNGIDDDCDGLIDEGCPCTVFSQNTQTFELDLAVMSTGVGWVSVAIAGGDPLVTVDLAGSGTIGTSSVPAQQGRQTLAWNGSELSYVGTGGGIEFVTSIGSPTHSGPALGLPTGLSQLRWTGSGYDVIAGQNSLGFVRTDGSGVATTAPATSSVAVSTIVPVLLGQRPGADVALYYEEPTVGSSGVYLAAPDPPAAISGTLFDALGIENQGGIASSPTELAVVTGGDLFAVDATAVTPVSIPGFDGDLADVGWTGQGWDVAALTSGTDTLTLTLVHLDQAFAMTSSEQLVEVMYTSRVGYNAPTVVSDASRTFVAWPVTVDSGPITQYMYGRCH
jgi:hypothetical protein